MIIVYAWIAFLILIVLSDEISEKGWKDALQSVFIYIVIPASLVWLLCGVVGMWVN